MERRLVTILAVDAVGYSRLVGEDEDGALLLFNECRSLIEELIQKHNGRVFGAAGDSLMAEFQSPVEAVRSAVEVQHELAVTGEKLPNEQRMQFRLGLNLGDVVNKDGNLFGEGDGAPCTLRSTLTIAAGEAHRHSKSRCPRDIRWRERAPTG